jgi:hypothetical protein
MEFILPLKKEISGKHFFCKLRTLSIEFQELFLCLVTVNHETKLYPQRKVGYQVTEAQSIV